MLEVEKEHSENSTDKKQGVEPPMEELKFHVSSQGICYDGSAKDLRLQKEVESICVIYTEAGQLQKLYSKWLHQGHKPGKKEANARICSRTILPDRVNSTCTFEVAASLSGQQRKLRRGPSIQ